MVKRNIYSLLFFALIYSIHVSCGDFFITGTVNTINQKQYQVQLENTDFEQDENGDHIISYSKFFNKISKLIQDNGIQFAPGVALVLEQGGKIIESTSEGSFNINYLNGLTQWGKIILPENRQKNQNFNQEPNRLAQDNKKNNLIWYVSGGIISILSGGTIGYYLIKKIKKQKANI